MYFEDEFDPFSPETWSPKPRTLSDEERAEMEERISAIAERYRDSHESRQLLHHLKFGKADLSFHRRLRKDKEFKTLVDWIKCSEPRVERAIRELDHHVNSIRCPSCNHEFRRGEEIEVSEISFDWELFSSGE